MSVTVLPATTDHCYIKVYRFNYDHIQQYFVIKQTMIFGKQNFGFFFKLDRGSEKG